METILFKLKTRDWSQIVSYTEGGEDFRHKFFSHGKRVRGVEQKAGLRYNRIQNTSSKIKHIQMPCLVQTKAI